MSKNIGQKQCGAKVAELNGRSSIKRGLCNGRTARTDDQFRPVQDDLVWQSVVNQLDVWGSGKFFVIRRVASASHGRVLLDGKGEVIRKRHGDLAGHLQLVIEIWGHNVDGGLRLNLQGQINESAEFFDRIIGKPVHASAKTLAGKMVAQNHARRAEIRSGTQSGDLVNRPVRIPLQDFPPGSKFVDCALKN